MKNKGIELVKQTPVHSRERLKRSSKNKLINKKIETEIEFAKQTPMHPRERLKRNNRKISIDTMLNMLVNFLHIQETD